MLKFFVLLAFIFWTDCPVQAMNTHVSHFEYLTYNVHDLHSQHSRARRSLLSSGKKKSIQLEFESHGRHFHLTLVRDDTIFHPDAMIETPEWGEFHHENITHLYHGYLRGVKGSTVFGSIIDGIFRGVIEDPARGIYYVEENTNFFGGRNGQSPISGYRGHSVMYHENAVKLPAKYKSVDHCGSGKHEIMEKMKAFQKSAVETEKDDDEKVLKRRKRQLNQDLNTCYLYLQSDYVLYDEYRSSEVIISRLAEHVKVANRIYGETPFAAGNGELFRGLNFRVRRIKVNDSSSRNDPTNPFRSPNIGVEKFLDIISMQNHNLYCLAYVFTNRDFDNGVLGLAWVGSVSGSSGGICEKYKKYSDGSSKSLNTGLVTFKNYGTIMPARVSHITFAHEVGHNFGSPHDSGAACTPGENNIGGFGTDGNYIMYARATSGNDLNNDKFSGCSIRNISMVLEAKKDRCFEASGQPICGNQLIEEGEVCDCGYPEDCAAMNDTCCEPASTTDRTVGCKLKPGALCSITQGDCCARSCQFKSSTTKCANETECQSRQNCDGNSAVCPAPAVQPNGTFCRLKTQTCFNGECSESVCLGYPELLPCECTIPEGSMDRSILCHTCCARKGEEICRSTGDPSFIEFFENKTIFLEPGSACEDYNGYCDVFSNCRLVDADGPLSRLKQAIFNPEFYSSIKRWIIDYWWAVMLMAIAMVLLMIGFIKICSVHTPTHNPRLPKHKPIPGAATLQRMTQHRQQARNRNAPGPSSGRAGSHQMTRIK